jgi:hypothetical protein
MDRGGARDARPRRGAARRPPGPLTRGLSLSGRTARAAPR